MVSHDETFWCILVVTQCLAYDVVCIGGVVLLVAFRINQEVSGHPILDDEIVERGGIVIAGSKVDGCCCRTVYVCTHVSAILVVGVVVELAICTSVISVGAIYSVDHVLVLLRCYLGRIIFRS